MHESGWALSWACISGALNYKPVLHNKDKDNLYNYLYNNYIYLINYKKNSINYTIAID